MSAKEIHGMEGTKFIEIVHNNVLIVYKISNKIEALNEKGKNPKATM